MNEHVFLNIKQRRKPKPHEPEGEEPAAASVADAINQAAAKATVEYDFSYALVVVAADGGLTTVPLEMAEDGKTVTTVRRRCSCSQAAHRFAPPPSIYFS
eukprot:SAG31_NODE_5805_length_2320_cov_0.807294_2_plen_100_part_00